jgi:hypothetical protein
MSEIETPLPGVQGVSRACERVGAWRGGFIGAAKIKPVAAHGCGAARLQARCRYVFFLVREKMGRPQQRHSAGGL